MGAGVRARGADVSFRDVTIKIPDRRCDQGCEWRHTPEAWAEIWEKPVEIEAWARPDEFVRYGRRACWGGGDGNIVIERLCLSLLSVEKPLNSKVIKSFVPELRSRKCFRVSGFLCSMYMLWTFYVRFTYPYHGYVTDPVDHEVVNFHGLSFSCISEKQV